MAISSEFFFLFPVLRVRIRIRIFLGLPDPHPDLLVRSTDPDPSIIKAKIVRKSLIFPVLCRFIFEE
jgi:hypothetical protein